MCNLCPRMCEVRRESGEVGYCKAPFDMVIATYSLHLWEEPVISVGAGSGTIFFSYCNLGCCFCQNYEISSLHKGRVVSVEEFSDICLELQDKGASNINLVTGCMYIPRIVLGLRLAKKRGLCIPVVYNSSGYESVNGLRMLEGLVDVYLPDFKYFDNVYGVRYSKCDNYFECARDAIREMYRQVGRFYINDDGVMERGVIVRHLMLPGLVLDSKRVIKFLYDEFGDNIFISIMNQYTPVGDVCYEELKRGISLLEYDEVIDYAYDIGVINAFVQEGGTVSESFIPDFSSFSGV